MDQKKYQSLKRITWDYDIPVEDIQAVLSGRKERAGHWDRDALIVRMLEKMSWYELLDLLGPEVLAEKLTSRFLSRLYNKEKREKYERLGKILRGEPVSFAEWGPGYRAKIRGTLFSDRWYRS